MIADWMFTILYCIRPLKDYFFLQMDNSELFLIYCFEYYNLQGYFYYHFNYNVLN